MTFRARGKLKNSLLIPLIAACAISVLAFTQFQILCEIGEFQKSPKTMHHLAAATAPGGDVHDQNSLGSPHTGEHAHSHENDSSNANAHSDAHHSHEHSHSSSESEEDACCDTSPEMEFAQAVRQLVPLKIDLLLFSLPALALEVSASPNDFHAHVQRILARHGPPPLSLSHIPTTILRI